MAGHESQVYRRSWRHHPLKLLDQRLGPTNRNMVFKPIPGGWLGRELARWQWLTGRTRSPERPGHLTGTVSMSGLVIPCVVYHHHLADLAELTTLLLDAPPDSTVRGVLGEAVEELPELLYWSRVDCLDRAGLNRALTGHPTKGHSCEDHRAGQRGHPRPHRTRGP